MNIESQIQALEHKVEAMISPEPGFFLVEVRIKPTNNVKVFIDADQGISIDKLVQLNRRLYKDIEESQFFPSGDFSLEVSSPGLDEPLKMHRQYVKNIGRYVEVMLNEGLKKEGKLVSVTEGEIELEEEISRPGKGPGPGGSGIGTGPGVSGKGHQGGKKKEIIHEVIPFDQIKTTKIQIKF
jgi:ribosome maturation factor RimP